MLHSLIVDQLIPNALRNNCGAHFGSRFLLVSQVVNWNTQKPAGGLLCRGYVLPNLHAAAKKKAVARYSPPATRASLCEEERLLSYLFY